MGGWVGGWVDGGEEDGLNELLDSRGVGDQMKQETDLFHFLLLLLLLLLSSLLLFPG